MRNRLQKKDLEFGISEKIARKISRSKKEPSWMLEKRLRALELYKKADLPKWGPDLSGLNLDAIKYYIDPLSDEKHSWDEVPEEVRDTFEKLGIPEAERKILAGSEAQYDSHVIYQNIKSTLAEKGVVFENMDVAVCKHEKMVREYFMTNCVPIHAHKFTMLHAAVWSGGTFIYIPKNTRVELPLQAYFRMNAIRGGQFEHTLIIADEGSDVHYIEGCSAPRYETSSLHAGCVEIFVFKGARVRYSSIENWSKNTYNLNTKRALVYEDGRIEWVNGNMGAGTTMLYPTSILRGRGAKSESLGIAIAGQGQRQDIGAKCIHAAPWTSSFTRSRSISMGGGETCYRGLVKVHKSATGSSASVACDALLMDEISVSKTHPVMQVENDDVDIAHEARVGKLGDEEIFYMTSRGISEERATQLLVFGFFEPVIKQLPLEYAIELNRLIEMELAGKIA